jgi:hypothetical protein
MMEKMSATAAMEVVAACERLSLDYAYLADNLRMDEWAQLFTEDAELVGFGETHSGRAAIKVAGGDRVTMHILTNIRIDPLSADEAEGSVYATLYAKPRSGELTDTAPLFLGFYRDRYRRTAEGWRIARREYEPFAGAAAPQ